MTKLIDKNPNDKEIVKMLGRLSCKTLNDCKLINAIIDLINHLQAENKRLNIVKREYQELYDESQSENKRLRNILDGVLDRQPLLVERSEKYDKVKPYKEFAEKINNIIESLIEQYSIKDFEEFKAIRQVLRGLKNDTNNLLKELVDEVNDSTTDN